MRKTYEDRYDAYYESDMVWEDFIERFIENHPEEVFEIVSEYAEKNMLDDYDSFVLKRIGEDEALHQEYLYESRKDEEWWENEK